MVDVIRGQVTNVVDGDTFDIGVISRDANNKYIYGFTERIRIANFNASEINTLKGVAAKLTLHSVLFNKYVKLWVYTSGVYPI